MDIAQVITDGIIKQLENGVAPWVKPWSNASASAPYNPSSGTTYRGINFIWLSLVQSSGEFGSSSKWLTYKQAQSIGAQVKKGAKGVNVVFYKPLNIKGELNPTTNTHESKVIPMLKSYTVFNADMIEGLPADIAPTTVKNDFQTIEECELFLKHTGAIIKHGGDKAFYIPSKDFIQLPEKIDFRTTKDYYATALHEVSHWTGHETRINRDFSKSKRFGDSAYAFEELVAELGSAMLCAHLKIDGQLQHASYINNWLTVLRKDSKAILKASAEAQKILDFTIN